MTTDRERLGEIEAREAKARDGIIEATRKGCRFTVSIPTRKSHDLDCLVCDLADDSAWLRTRLALALAVVEAARAGIAGMEPDKGDGAFWLGHGNCVRISKALAAFDRGQE